MTEPHRLVPARAPADAPESALVAAALLGDGNAFEALMRRHNQLVFRIARSILNSDAEAEEAAQEAWLKAWRALAGFRADSRFATWIVRIARNEALGRRRRPTALVIPLEAAMISSDRDTQAALADSAHREPEEELARLEIRRLMESRIDLLPDLYRTVFVLRAVEELSVEDVAAALEIPEATVRTRFFRARSLLRQGLAQEIDRGLADTFAFDGGRCDRIVTTVRARGRAEGLDRSDRTAGPPDPAVS